MAYKKQKNVNIDALIAREDFEAADETTNTASNICGGSGEYISKPEISTS